MTIEGVSSSNVWFCELWLLSAWVTERESWKTCDFVSYYYWARELLNVWIVGKRVILWVMTIERVSYWTCEYLENVWFWGVGFLNLVLFNSFHNRVEFGTILEGVRKFGGGVGRVDHLKPSLGTPLVGNLWFCDFWLLSLWVTERVCCRKTCDFVGYAYSACELSKNVWFCELCILNLSYWPCEMLKNCVFLMSYACWACVFFLRTCDFVRYTDWVCELLWELYRVIS